MSVILAYNYPRKIIVSWQQFSLRNIRENLLFRYPRIFVVLWRRFSLNIKTVITFFRNRKVGLIFYADRRIGIEWCTPFPYNVFLFSCKNFHYKHKTIDDIVWDWQIKPLRSKSCEYTAVFCAKTANYCDCLQNDRLCINDYRPFSLLRVLLIIHYVLEWTTIILSKRYFKDTIIIICRTPQQHITFFIKTSLLLFLICWDIYSHLNYLYKVQHALYFYFLLSKSSISKFNISKCTLDATFVVYWIAKYN